MKARHKGHHGHHRAKGGGTDRAGHYPQLVSGNPEVVDEAEERKTGDEDTVAQNEKRARHKRGGAVKHGRHHGKHVDGDEGKKAHHRGDRPRRASGGGVGANRSPLSTAHNATSQTAGSSNPADTYGGTPK